MADTLDLAIRHTYCSQYFWELLDNANAGGPFDGACLICAEAIQLAAGEGDIVRIVDESNTITHHYGVRIGGAIYDFDGGCGGLSWARRFSRNENIDNRIFTIATGVSSKSPIRANSRLSKKIAQVIISNMKPMIIRLAS